MLKSDFVHDYLDEAAVAQADPYSAVMAVVGTALAWGIKFGAGGMNDDEWDILHGLQNYIREQDPASVIEPFDLGG